MNGSKIYSALSFQKAFRIAWVAALLVHLAILFNPFFQRDKVVSHSADTPVLRAERIVLVPPPEPPKVVKKIVRAKIIPKVVEKPVEDEKPLPEPEPVPTAETVAAVEEPVFEAPPAPLPVPVVKESPKPSADSIKKVMRAYLGKLKKELEKGKSYPATAKRLKQEGTVRVRFTILEDGSLENVEIAESSRYSSLDKSAQEAVENMGRFSPIPSVLNKKSWRIEIPVQYKLNTGRTP